MIIISVNNGMFVKMKTVAIVNNILTARISLDSFRASFESLSGVIVDLDEVYLFLSLHALLFWRLNDRRLVHSKTTTNLI